MSYGDASTKNNVKYCRKCTTPTILWHWVDENTIIILGQNGQDYEIKFNDIYVKCRKCGTVTYEVSDVADMLQYAAEKSIRPRTTAISSTIPNPYRLNSVDRNALLAKLSKNQKQVYSLLVEQGRKVNVKSVAERVALPKKIIESHIKTIKDKIKEINPNFGEYRYVETTAQTVDNKEELEALHLTGNIKENSIRA